MRNEELGQSLSQTYGLTAPFTQVSRKKGSQKAPTECTFWEEGAAVDQCEGLAVRQSEERSRDAT